MATEKSSSSLQPGQEVAPEVGAEEKGRLVNGAFFSDEEIDEFSRQDFLAPFEMMELSSMPRVDSIRFIQRYLPIMMDPKAEEDKTSGAWLNMWRTEIDKNVRLSVILTDENGKDEYIIPPPFGTIHTGNTGHPDSIEGRFAYLATHSRRLQSAHNLIKSRMFNHIKIDTEQNKAHQDDMVRLLADAGYLSDLAPDLVEPYKTKGGTSVTRYLARTTGGKPISEVTSNITPSAPAPGAPVSQLDTDGGGMDYD